MAITTNNIETLKKAEEAEADDNLETAASLYEEVIKQKIIDENPYNRLMIIYRKQKQYKDELRVINTGIRAFEEKYNQKSKFRKSNKTRITELSDVFMKTTGLKDKKGKTVYYPEPIGKWMKRKALVEKKLKSNKSG